MKAPISLPISVKIIDCFDALAITSSVPFRYRVSGAELRGVLSSGEVPRNLRAHLQRALSEAPVEMLSRIVLSYPADERNSLIETLRRIADEVHASGKVREWLNG